MAYDDGYYYGQCKIVAVVDDTADNGKTVLITTDGNKTYSGTIANKKCEFLLPPRALYTVQKVSGESVEFTTKVEAGYGDCILVHLNTGYVEVKQGDIVGLDYIKAATADNLKNKVPEATAVKELDSSLTQIKNYVVLWEGTLNVGESCDLSDSIDNYKQIVIEYDVGGDSTTNGKRQFSIIPITNVNYQDSVTLYAYGNWYSNNFAVVFTSNNVLKFIAEYHFTYSAAIITKIYGLK